jgi:hypothetical protein
MRQNSNWGEKGGNIKIKIPCTMPSVGWSGIKLAAIGLWSSGNAFSGVMNHASPSESGFGGCPNAQCQL